MWNRIATRQQHKVIEGQDSLETARNKIDWLWRAAPAFPQKLPGSVMFGGPGLDKLYVPTLSPAFMGRTADPLDGSTFVIEGLSVTGIEEPRFAG